LSTTLIQPDAASSWKQELSRLVATHQGRDGLSEARADMPAWGRPEPGSRAAQVAARVAARYAQAPSYSQRLAIATAALPAAPEASPGPLAASAGPFPRQIEALQAATPVQRSTQAWEPAVAPVLPATPSSFEAWVSQNSRLVREPDFALFPLQPATDHMPQIAKNDAPQDESRGRLASAEDSSGDDDFELTEPVLTPRANLIEFPRELVAPRKRRPRRAEGPLAADGLERQFNMFEADPGTLLIEPGAAGGEPAWSAPAWSGMKLEAQPPAEPEPPKAPVSLPALRLAPLGLRLAAVAVDGALIAAALLGSALVAATCIGHSLPAEIARISALLGFLLAYLLYQSMFFILDEATPGMRSSGLLLCTFDGSNPTRAQMRLRLIALLLSVLPVGLGIAWILIDDDHLCWHDRLSRTYLRKV
jgi:uncharacterized RDD family membrane protein YckC